jgi:DNA-directed RNA polymerase specialized sigma subunit
VVETRKVNEQELYTKWKETQSTQSFQKLYTSMKPLLYEAAKKASYGSNIPDSAHKVWAAQNFCDALRTFKPTAGASLQTHVYNTVHQKAKRLNYMYQNLGHIPEPRAMQVGLYQTELENLKTTLGREPSSAELADRLGWGLKDVAHIQKEIHKDLALEGGVEEQAIFESSLDEDILEDTYYELSPEEKLIYEYVFGKHGKPRMVKANNKIDFDGIGRLSGYSGSKARTVWGRVKVKVQKALKR